MLRFAAKPGSRLTAGCRKNAITPTDALHMNWLRSTQSRYTTAVVAFILLLVALTIAVIQLVIAPDLRQLEGVVVGNQVDAIAVRISEQLRKVEAQQRSITQTVAQMDSDSIDKLLPSLVDQYGDINVFGGGIWPLPNKRAEGRDKFSTFFARDAAGVLNVNTHWNSEKALKYWEQSWYANGQNSPKGKCTWANAYQDDASPQPRTNCAMPIYKGAELYGVATIDVTLGFFNHLVSDMEAATQGQILLVEKDGKIVSNSSQIKDNIVLKNVADIAGSSPLAAELKRLLPQLQAGAPLQTAFDKDGESQSLFVKPIPRQSVAARHGDPEAFAGGEHRPDPEGAGPGAGAAADAAARDAGRRHPPHDAAPGSAEVEHRRALGR